MDPMGIYGNIYHQYTPNVIYQHHGSYGLQDIKNDDKQFERVFQGSWNSNGNHGFYHYG